MRLRTYIGFIVVFLAVFSVATFDSTHGQMATSMHRFTNYGWPQAWLWLHTTDTTHWVNGQEIKGKHTVEGFQIDWLPCITAIGASVAISVVLILPFVFLDGKRARKNTA